MSDLQVVLIVLGSFIIVAVVIYNWMQERKLRNEVVADFIVPDKDVLTDDFHIDVDAYMIDSDLAEVTEKIKHFADTAPATNLSNKENLLRRISTPVDECFFRQSLVISSSARWSRYGPVRRRIRCPYSPFAL